MDISKHPLPTEKEVQTGIIQALNLNGWTVKRMPPSIYTSAKGVPDLYVCKNKRSAWIEVKSPNKKSKLSDEQRKWLEDVEGAGIVCIVARSVKFAVDVCDALECKEVP